MSDATHPRAVEAMRQRVRRIVAGHPQGIRYDVLERLVKAEGPLRIDEVAPPSVPTCPECGSIPVSIAWGPAARANRCLNCHAVFGIELV